MQSSQPATSKTWMLHIFLGFINVMNVKLCTMVVLSELQPVHTNCLWLWLYIYMYICFWHFRFKSALNSLLPDSRILCEILSLGKRELEAQSPLEYFSLDRSWNEKGNHCWTWWYFFSIGLPTTCLDWPLPSMEWSCCRWTVSAQDASFSVASLSMMSSG